MASSNFMDIAKKVPAFNAKARKRLQAGRDLQMQQAAQQQIPAGVSAVRAAQAITPAMQEQAGQQQLQQQQATQQQLSGLAGAELQRQQQASQVDLQRQEMQQNEQLQQQGQQQKAALAREDLTLKNALTDEELAGAKRLSELGLQVDTELSSMSRNMRKDLANLGGDVKAKLFNSQLIFDRNELGRKFNNHRQVLKATIASAVNQQDLRKKLTVMQQTSAKELQMLEAVHNKLLTSLQQGYLDEKRELDQASKGKIAEMIRQMKKKIDRKKRDAANTASIIKGAVSIAGIALAPATGGASLYAGAAANAALNRQ